MSDYINGETIHVNGGMYMVDNLIINLIRKINKKGFHVRGYKSKNKKNSCRSFRY